MVPRTRYRRQPSSAVVGLRGGGPTQSWDPQEPRGAGPSGTGSSSACSSCQIREAYSVWKRPSAPRSGGEGGPSVPETQATTVPPKTTTIHPRRSGKVGRQKPGEPVRGQPGLRAPGEADADGVSASQGDFPFHEQLPMVGPVLSPGLPRKGLAHGRQNCQPWRDAPLLTALSRRQLCLLRGLL